MEFAWLARIRIPLGKCANFMSFQDLYAWEEKCEVANPARTPIQSRIDLAHAFAGVAERNLSDDAVSTRFAVANLKLTLGLLIAGARI